MTMSPVMLVNFSTASGASAQAILKLYDRRFGTHLRVLYGKHAPCQLEDEDAFRFFLSQGKMEPFIRELEEENKNSLIPLSASSFYDNSPDGRARYEAALWHEANEHFNNETQAYAQLIDLQGTSIPQVYAHIRLTSPGYNTNASDSRLQPETETEKYLHINGILIEVITGYNLWDLPISAAAPSDKTKWPAIIQQAVDKAYEINKRGLILKDSGPRNVMVDQSSETPFIIDLAQCYFKDRLFALWEEISLGEYERDGDDEDEDEWNPEVEYWERVRSSNNPASIGLLMTKRLLLSAELEVDINYPDYKKIINDTKRQLSDAGVAAATGTKTSIDS
ncbi:hypothetical protein NM208_g4511 [Fusarium decemcellulare]|uniref:Uncharacterized protein n=1 Tax=Fusarium decemcellulare TaxID=57161 RepID=A0ACC1SKH9_9HYPO|nr:hypothetical protein NM208_g4511 [Fusarium decemcellulare]